MKTSFLTAFKTTVALLLVLAAITPPAAAQNDCGALDGSLIYVNAAFNNGMDARVWGCPGDWESCCAVCGSNMQEAGQLTAGWSCKKDFFSTGIWLKGCSTTGTCL